MEAQQQPTILLVEDESIVALTQKRTIENFGYRVLTASTGEEAVKAVAADKTIDLVLMDIDLGAGIDGTEAAELILERHDLPIVFLSSHTEPEYVQRTQRITSYGYVVKHTAATVLEASLQMAFRLFEARRRERAKEQELERYFELSLDLVCILDLDRRYVRVNPEWEHVLGYPLSEIGVDRMLSLVHPDDRTATLTILAELEQQTTITAFENRLQCGDGSYRWIEWRARPQGNTIYAAARDVTERKQEKRDLAAQKKRFEHLFNESPLAVAVVDSDEQVVECNREFTRLFGYEASEALGRAINDLIAPPGRLEEAARLGTDVLRKGRHVYLETCRRRRDGIPVDVAITGTPMEINGQTYAYAIYQTISERKRAEAALLESEREYRRLFETAPIAIWEQDFSAVKQRIDRIKAENTGDLRRYLASRPQLVYDLAAEVRVIDVNRTTLELFGASKEECARVTRAFGPDSLRSFTSELIAIAEGTTELITEQKLVGPSGEPLYLELYWSVAPGYKDSYGRVRVYAIDITSHRQAENALRESEARLTAFVDALPDLCLVLDQDGRYIEVLSQNEDLLYRPAAELEGRLLHEVLPLKQAQLLHNIVLKTLKTGSSQIVEYELEVPAGYRWFEAHSAAMGAGKRNPARAVPVESQLAMGHPVENHPLAGHPVSGQPGQVIQGANSSGCSGAGEAAIADSAGVPPGSACGGEAARVLLVIRDTTEHKHAQERLSELLKRQELLLKETHHRLKNNMGAIASMLSLQAAEQRDPSSRRALNEAAGRSHGMMILYDKLYRSEKCRELSIREYIPQLVDEIVAVFNPSLHPSVPIRADVQVEDIVLTAGNVSALGIMLSEMVTNSMKHAFPEGGTGTIAVSATLIDGTVELEYRDNGVGLPEAIDLGDHAGFGMQLIGMLVEQLDGTIEIEREQGTRFRIRFPA